MSTINISLPADQVSFIDNLVKKHSFANRSELVRTVFRYLKHDPAVLEKASILPLKSPSSRDGNQVLSSFRETGLYSEDFLQDLKEGINDSDYFSKIT